MAWNYDFCMASSVVVLILIIYNLSVNRENGKVVRLYMCLLVMSWLCCVMDMVSGLFLMRRFKDAIWLNNIWLVVYNLIQASIPGVYFIYIIIVSKYIDKNDRGIIKWLVPNFIIGFMVCISPFTGLLFVYDENGYSRGFLMWLPILVAGVYMVLGHIILCKSSMHEKKTYGLVSAVFMVLPAVATVVQMLYSDLILISSAIAIGCLIMQLVLQNSRMIYAANEKEIIARKVAEEASLEKSTFLANMTHEIRTPMNAICGMADILERCDLSEHEMDYVQTIQVAGKNLLGIIDNILDFSKVDAGKLSLINVDYRIDKLLSSVENIIATRVYGKGIKFEIYVENGVPMYLRGDSDRIHQILINILGNAVKFTEQGKIILNVKWEKVQDNKVNLIFCVSDTGIGIKQEDMHKLFKQFSQVDPMRNRKREGTGLGLALSKGLANLMNGDITVTSEYGQGSKFTISLEQEIVENAEYDATLLSDYVVFVYEKDEDSRLHIISMLDQIGVESVIFDSRENISSDGFEKHDGKNKILLYSYEDIEDISVLIPDNVIAVALIEYYTILKKEVRNGKYIRKPYDIFKVYNELFSNISFKAEKKIKKENVVMNNVRVAVVDDNRVNLKVAATQLMEWNVLPEVFTGGQAIIKALERGRQYDVIFMDYMMPEMDGVETTIKIRAMDGKYFKTVPIIALTANAVKGAEREYEKAGMNDCLFKPINLEKLLEMLIKHLPEGKVEIHMEDGN